MCIFKKQEQEGDSSVKTWRAQDVRRIPLFYLFFFLSRDIWILVPQPGVELILPALEG